VHFAKDLVSGCSDDLDFYINFPVDRKLSKTAEKLRYDKGFYRYFFEMDTIVRRYTRIKRVPGSKQLHETFPGYSYYVGRTE
jgi:hypothetical protein